LAQDERFGSYLALFVSVILFTPHPNTAPRWGHQTESKHTMAALVAAGAGEPWRVTMKPPPGLADTKGPGAASVVSGQAMPPSPIATAGMAGMGASVPVGSGEWVQSVLQMAPYMNSGQLRQALSMLDSAIVNSQQATALPDLSRHAYHAGSNFPMLIKAELARMQVCEQQHSLLREIHRLQSMSEAAAQAGFGAPTSGSITGAMAAPAWVPEAPTTRPVTTLKATGVHRREQQGAAHQGPQTPAPAQRAPKREGGGTGGRQVQTLSTSLQLLSKEDPECLFIVRRINKLGFKAARKLKQHFSAYGGVVRVLVAHSTVRQQVDKQSYALSSRQRPSSLGFVQMTSAEAVQKVLETGAEQEVDGSLIRVQKFERQHSEEAAAAEEEAEKNGNGAAEDEGSKSRTTSDASTAYSKGRRRSNADSYKSRSMSSEQEEILNSKEACEGSWQRQQSELSAASTSASTASASDNGR